MNCTWCRVRFLEDVSYCPQCGGWNEIEDVLDEVNLHYWESNLTRNEVRELMKVPKFDEDGAVLQYWPMMSST